MNRKLSRIFAGLLVILCLFSLTALPAAADSDVVIVLDPGHGKNDNGANKIYNDVHYMEQDLCYSIATYCKAYLEEHYSNVTVYLTRTPDENPTLEERVQIAKAKGADFLLSLHLNTFEDDTSVSGATAFVPAGTYNQSQAETSWAVADAILSELESLGLKNRGQTSKTLKITTYPNGGKADSYYLIRYGVEANLPTIIMEQCFLTCPSDFDNYLSTEEKLQSLAEASARGLAASLGLIEIAPEPTETDPPVTETPDIAAPVTDPIPEPSETTDPATEQPSLIKTVGSILLKLVLVLLCLVILAFVVLLVIRMVNIHRHRKRMELRRQRKRAQSAKTNNRN